MSERPSGPAPMDAERFRAVKEAWLEARELPAAERARFLEHLAASDPALAAEVESLLAADAEPARIIGTGAAVEALPEGLARALAVLPPAARPERIGSYRIVDVLGEGGMGTVFRAVQEAPIRREVALKVVRAGLDLAPVIARFESERQALAIMDHPNIAHVFDAGADAGRPYFAMELVPGSPITEFCDRERLTTRERIDLFLELCDAIQHAHQKGVIHRDLKPSNVLVARRNGSLALKVIDFGIAKALGETAFGESAPAGEVTLAGQVLGTPDYISPEQAGAIRAPVDTRTDVYSLGVLLYELLCGVRPFESTGERSLLAHARRLRERDPARPSTRITAGAKAARRTTAQRLRRQIAGDLDNIVLMALRREPERRYGSVEQLAADLRRHRAGHPVTARPSAWPYRTRKFVRRNWAVVSAAAGVVLALALVAVGLWFHSARLTAERNRARTAEDEARRSAARERAEAAAANQVTEYLVGLFEASNPAESRGREITARELLARGTERIEELRSQPALQARLLRTFGEVYHSLGDYPRAGALLDSALVLHRRALATPGGAGDSAAGAVTLADLGTTLSLLATVAHDRADFSAAESLEREALATRLRALGPRHPDVAASMNYLAITLQATGKMAEAESLYRESLALHRELLGERDPEVAWDMNTLGQVIYARGDYVESERLFRAALDIQRERLGSPHPDLAASLNNLGGVLNMRGEPKAAEPVFREALAVYRSLYGEDHAAVARALHNLGLALRDQGRAREAEALFRQALAANQRLLGPEHRYVATCLVSLAGSLRDQDRLAEAEALLRKALEMRRRLLGPDHTDVHATLLLLGEIAHQAGRLDEAERLEAGALDALRKQLPPDHPQVARAEALMGAMLLERGVTDRAEVLLRTALASQRRRLSIDHWQIAETRSALGACLRAEGRAAEAESLLVSGHAALRAALGDDDPRTRRAAGRLVSSTATESVTPRPQ